MKNLIFLFQTSLDESGFTCTNIIVMVEWWIQDLTLGVAKHNESVEG